MNPLNDPFLAAEREARQGASHAAMLSRAEGKHVDSFGFPVNPRITGKTWAEIQQERAAELSTEDGAEFVNDMEPAA